MKILFVSGLYSEAHTEMLREYSSGDIQNAANVFQWNVVWGLLQNNINLEVVSLPFLPSFPLGYKKCHTPSGDIIVNDNKIGRVLPYCDLVLWKKNSIRYRLEKYLLNWIKLNEGEDKLIILTYSPYIPFIKAIRNVKKRYPHKKIELVSIVTDLVDDYKSSGSNKGLRRIQCEIEKRETHNLYKYIDKFVLLSKYMVEKIPETQKSYIVVEGLAQVKEYHQVEKNGEVKTLLYTGLLDYFTGVKDLVDAFHKISDPNLQLIICGLGCLESAIKQAASIDSRIIFKGLVSRESAVLLQQEATLLINPRKPDNQLTRYSFPSKTMEYLSSGTPMLGYRLDGIPEEYYSYYYTIDTMDVDGLAERIQEVIHFPQSELNKKAEEAYNFILQNKTAKMQMKRLLDFMCE